VNVQQLIGRLVDVRTRSWDTSFDALAAFAAAHGHTDPPPSDPRGRWAALQRSIRRAGMMQPDRAAKLEALPGWAWDLNERRALEQWAFVDRVARTGVGLDLNDPAVADRPLAPRTRKDARTVGEWCARQRLAYRRGDLDPAWRARLSQVPGWTWRATPARDREHVDLLAEYVAWKKCANVPETWSEGGLHLGLWLKNVRRLRAFDLLSRPLQDEIIVAVAGADAGGALRWYTGEARWLAGYEALLAYVRREGTTRAPEAHREILDGAISFPLCRWCVRQRYLHRHGELPAKLAALLERVPGWEWEIGAEPRVRKDIGRTRHGTPAGYVKGCRCDDCSLVDADRKQSRADRIRSGGPSSLRVDAVPARAHARVLHGRGATRAALGRATGLNEKTIHGLLDGTVVTISPQTEAAVLACTWQDVQEACLLDGNRVDAGPTWELVRDILARGWPKAWVAREIGQVRTLQLSTSTVNVRTAKRVAALHEALGGRTAPAHRPHAAIPPLCELLEPAA
jgi:hypothetical protein